MLLEHTQLLSNINIISVTFRLALALLLGGMLGLERERKQRPAGLRTYVAVCIGATLACVTNMYMTESFQLGDPARIPAQVISGMGFLGAGTILVTRKNQIKGLTTAAGLWCCAAIGIAVGSGFYSGAIISTIMIVICFRVLSVVDRIVIKSSKYMKLYVEYDNSVYIRNLIQYAKNNKYIISELEKLSDIDEDFKVITFVLKITDNKTKDDVIDEIEKLSNCISVEQLNS